MNWSPLARCVFFLAMTPGVAVASGEQIYWTDTAQPSGTCKIRRAERDGANVEIPVGELKDLRGIAVDAVGGRMYWADVTTPTISSARLDGTDLTPALVSDLAGGIAVDSLAGKLYWTGTGPKIRRANLNGTNIEDLVTSGLVSPAGIAVDHAGGKMYWSDLGTSQIERANLDGSGVEVLIGNTHGDVNGLTLDLIAGQIYWCVIPQPQAQGIGSIERANLDGTLPQTLFSGLTGPTTVAVDAPNGKVYWSNSWSGHSPGIMGGNLDGTNPHDVISNLGQPWGIALGPGTPTTIHYYRFENGAAGSQATAPGSILDSAATAVHGTPQGGPTYASDVPANFLLCHSNERSMTFDGVDDSITFPSPFIFHAQFSDATLEFWMKAPVQSSNDIFWTTGGSADADRFHLYTATPGCIGLDYRDTGNIVRTLLPDGAFTYPANIWTHVAITRVVEANGSHTYRFYKDGVQVHTASDVSPDLPTATTWTIAGRPSYQGFNGLLDEIRMSDVALQPGEFLNVPPLPCIYCTAKINSLGCTPTIGYTGIPTLSGPDNFHITAANVLNLKSGMMLWSGAQGNSPFHGGILCVASPIFRTPIQNSGGSPTGSDCTGSYTYLFSQSYMAAHFLGIGSSACCQFWSRDPGFPPFDNIGLTDGLIFEIGP